MHWFILILVLSESRFVIESALHQLLHPTHLHHPHPQLGNSLAEFLVEATTDVKLRQVKRANCAQGWRMTGHH